MNIPKGWKLVPIDLASQPEMIKSISDVIGPYSAMIMWEKLLDSAPTPPAQEDEPVGFIWRDKAEKEQWRFSDDTSLARDADQLTNTDIRMVYTHPANDELRRAVRQTLDYMSLDANKPERGKRIEENLRAALEKVKE